MNDMSGQYEEGSVSHGGPVHQRGWVTRSFARIPRDAQSAGLSLVGTYRQQLAWDQLLDLCDSIGHISL